MRAVFQIDYLINILKTSGTFQDVPALHIECVNRHVLVAGFARSIRSHKTETHRVLLPEMTQFLKC